MDCNIFTMRKISLELAVTRELGMIQLYDGGAYLVNGTDIVRNRMANQTSSQAGPVSKEEGRKGTIAYSILAKS